MRNLYFLMTSVALGRGGLTKSMLARARVLSNAGFKVTILTLDYQGNFLEEKDHLSAVSALRGAGALSRAVTVRNFFHEITGFSKEKSTRRYLRALWWRLLKHVPRWSEYEGEIKNFDNRGRLRSIRKDGKDTVFSVWGNVKYCIGSNGRYQISDDGRLEKGWAEWINDCLNEDDVLFVDQRQLYPFVRRLEGNFKKIAVTHSTHYKHPHVFGGPLSPDYLDLYTNGGYDLIALLTDKQLKDAADLGFDVSVCKVLPNFSVKLRRDLARKKPNLMVAVARFEYEKRLEHAVLVAERVARDIPNFKLRIYGKGKDKGSIANMVAKLDLKKVVELAGFTEDPLGKLAEAQCSILTSRFEGLPLSVMESMSVGTPVVAYDIPFGPSDLIVNGQNGYLIEPEDIEEMAKSIIKIMRSPELASKLGRAAMSDSAKFSEENFKARWVSVINNL